MLTTSGTEFLRDGQPHLIASGALHYCRVHPDQWADRLRRLRVMGANAVETYIPWNFHAPAPGVYDFTGAADLARFLDTAADEDLDIIVRPGPYACGEWENGGFPGWLLADPGMRLRTSNPAYLAEVDRWFDVVIPMLAERQYPEGGRIILAQIENEYGSFGDDLGYLEHLRDGLRARGITIPLVTSDGPGMRWLLAGTVDGALPTMNFGSRAEEHLEMFAQEFPDTPPMCMEFWHGWFDHWGQRHHTRDAAEAAGELQSMLSNRMSVNLYMGVGSTNFGLWNGSNHDGELGSTITSYDYDAPIAEDGRLTPKFDAFRAVIAQHLPVPDLPEDLVVDPPALSPRDLAELSSGVLTCDDLQGLSLSTVASVPGLRAVAEPVPEPPTFEQLGLERGILLLRSTVAHAGGTAQVRLHGLRDRAHVFVDGRLIGIVGRDEGTPESLEVDSERGMLQIDVVVESQGRINFGPLLGDRKGVLGGVWWGNRFVNGWCAYPLALDVVGDAVSALCAVERPAPVADGLTYRQYALDIAPGEAGTDANVSTAQRGRGFLWVDAAMLGRFWHIGPQQSLYCPGPLLGAGSHTVTILETDPPIGAPAAGLRLVAEPDLDSPATEETAS